MSSSRIEKNGIPWSILVRYIQFYDVQKVENNSQNTIIWLQNQVPEKKNFLVKTIEKIRIQANNCLLSRPQVKWFLATLVPVST